MSRTLVIGDIHGCWAELQELLEAAAITPEDTVISVGDLVDRGPEPGPVVDLFRTRPNSLAITGNHERKHVRGPLSYSQRVCRLQLGEGYAEAVAWMAGLPYHLETDEVRVVHWGHFPGTPLHAVPEAVRAGSTSGCKALAERYGETPWYAHYDEDKPICFGHAVVGEEALVIEDRVFGLDTGACHGGRLTGLLLPERRLVSVPAREDHWAKVRVAWQEAVLLEEPWEEMTWGKLAKRVRRARSPQLPGGVLDGILAWSVAVQGRIPALAEVLAARCEALLEEVGPEDFGRAAAADPAGRWLLPWHKGRLKPASLGCQRPAEVFALAQALGVEPGVAPRPGQGEPAG